MNKKTFFLVIGIIGGVLLTSLLYFAFMFFVAFGGLNFLIPVPKPEVTHGEFPFQLTYEINGETKVIEDTIVCEFDGFIVEGENGKYRKWKTSLNNGNERLTLLDLRPLNEINEFGQTMLELSFYYGNAEYYMGDVDNNRQRGAQGLGRVSYHYQNTDGTTGGSGYGADVAYEKYKIRLINWECAPPIENTFR